MAVLNIPSSLRSLCDDCTQIEVEGSTLRAVFNAVAKQHPELTSRILDHQGLRPDIAVAIDGSILDQSALTETIAADTEIYLVPPIGGGSQYSSLIAKNRKQTAL